MTLRQRRVRQAVDASDADSKGQSGRAVKLDPNRKSFSNADFDEPTTQSPACEKPVSGATKRNRTLLWMQQATTVCGWCFEILTVVMAVTDVVTDALVAHQFYAEGRMGFFWVNTIVLLTATAWYALILTDRVGDISRQYVDRSSKAIGTRLYALYVDFAKFVYAKGQVERVLWCMPVAQFFPLIDWIETTWLSPHDGNTEATNWTKEIVLENSREMKSAAMAEKVKELEMETFFLRTIDTAVVRNLRRHLLFYIETVVESVPQAIIQLLAITQSGEVSRLQIVSVSLSLFSIITKVYVVGCATFSAKMIVWKIAAVSYDVFLLFYLVATVLCRNAADQVEAPLVGLAGEVGAAHVVRLTRFVGLALVTHLVCAVIALRLERGFYLLRDVGYITFFYVIGFVPALVVLEFAHLSFVVLALRLFEPSEGHAPSFAKLFSCAMAGDYNGWVYSSVDAAIQSCRRVATNRTSTQRFARIRDVVSSTAIDDPPPDTEGKARFNHFQLVLADIWAAKNSVFAHLSRSSSDSSSSSAGQRRSWNTPDYVIVLHIPLVLMYVVGKLQSAALPFINIAYHLVRHNPVQDVCAVGLLVSGVTVVALSYHAFWYIVFTWETQAVLWAPNLTNVVYSVILRRTLPDHVGVLQSCVPPEVLPRELTTCVAEYIAEGALDLTQLSAEQCKEMKECVE